MNKSDIDIFIEELEKVDPEISKEELNVVPIQRETRPEELRPLYPAPDIKTRVYTDYTYIKELTDSDFNISGETLIDLTRNKEDIKISNGYFFILFIDESSLGKEYLQRWLELAQIVKDDYCNLAYVNLSFEKKILENFKKLASIENINHPFYWARFMEIPFMMVYKNHWPVGFYNGAKNQNSLVKFIIEEIYESLSNIDKNHFRRNEVSELIEEEIKESEKKIESYSIKEKAELEDRKEKEKIKNLDPRKQEILDSVNYLD